MGGFEGLKQSFKRVLPQFLVYSRRTARKLYSRRQLDYLEGQFEVSAYKTYDERVEIATILGLTEKQVQVWFKNRRSRAKNGGTCAYMGAK